MLKVRLSVLALASLSVVVTSHSHAATFREDFSSDPAEQGWKIFGDTNLFQWDATNRNLQVTWDSSQSNSYFYLPLGTVLARDDDFSFVFDVCLLDAGTGDTTGPMQVAAGFLNLADATSPDFVRGLGVCPNVVEFNYFPFGYFPGYTSWPTTEPAFVDRTSTVFAPYSTDPYVFELPTNEMLHIALTYTASNQTAVLEVSTNGVGLGPFPPLALNGPNSMFADTNDFRVTAFSISSYSEAGQYPPYVGSVLAHGVVSNVVVTVPPAPLRDLAGGFTHDGTWQVQFGCRTNWLYTLERTVDFVSWGEASVPATGAGASMVLQDTNALAGKAFYRIRANRP